MKSLIIIILIVVVGKYVAIFPHFFTNWLISVYPPIEGVSAAFIWLGLTLWIFLMAIFAGIWISKF